MRDGDGLVLDDGAIVRVAGRPEPLVEITAANGHELARLAWHIGNRHIDVQIAGDKLRIRRDHVIEDMLRGLGARLVMIEAAFDPSKARTRRAIMRHSTIITGIITTSMSMTKALLRSAPRKRDQKASPKRGTLLMIPLNTAALYRLMAWLRRPIRSARSPIRAASNGRSKPAT